ncbi:MAG: DUF445 family protein [Syntrophomonas sp.]|nr:DUF445 family protein [Syntrophomonas sp.]
MKRMYAIATFMFGLALAGSIIVWPFRGSFTGGLLFAAFEAALVGALADWFAVVALFRHPLGLKFIPHTAIIPNNRGRIIEGIVTIVEKDWLSLDFIKDKILDYQLIDGVASALETEEGRRGLERLAQSLIANTIQDLNPEDVARFVHLMLADNLNEIKISPVLVERLEASVKNLYGDDLIRIFLNWGIAATQGEDFERIIKRTLTRAAADYSNRGNFFRRLGKGLGESLDIVNYDEAAEALSNRINHFLVEMKEPSNQYHIRVKTEMDKLQIADPASASAMLSEMLKKIVGTDAGVGATADLFAALKTQLIAGGNEELPLIRFLTNMAIEQINIVRWDEARKSSMESWIKTELVGLLERYHVVIGQIVREKLQNLNDIGLVKSMEDKVGDDLQWIRINGTVIGALVGVLQYLLLHLL